MKEYFEGERKIIEYEFSDWEEGTIGNPNIEHSKEGVFLMIKDGVHVYTRVSREQYKLIDDQRQKLYWEKVDKRFTSLQKNFLDQFKKSGDPTRLIQAEIDIYESLFFEEKCQLKKPLTNDYFPIDGLAIHSINVIEYRKLYERLYLRGNREYHHTNSPNSKVQVGSGDHHFIIVEAYAKYLTWLQNFSKDSIMKEEFNLQELKPYMADNDLDFYYNADNIRNQDLVFATIDHFEIGPRKGLMKPLHFLNLLHKQKSFVVENVKKAHTVSETLKSLPMSEELRHILFGFILKWLGGYPINNDNPNYNSTLRLIEKEFLEFPKDTPEKEVCRKDWDRYLRIRQIEKDMNNFLQGKQASKELLEEKASSVKLDGFTNSQIVLIFHYFFEYVGLIPRKIIDVAPVAKFLHLITGKEFTSTANSDFYKKLQKAPNFYSDKQLFKDLNTIRHLFVEVELHEVVRMIDNEIDTAKSAIKHTI